MKKSIALLTAIALASAATMIPAPDDPGIVDGTCEFTEGSNHPTTHQLEGLVYVNWEWIDMCEKEEFHWYYSWQVDAKVTVSTPQGSSIQTFLCGVGVRAHMDESTTKGEGWWEAEWAKDGILSDPQIHILQDIDLVYSVIESYSEVEGGPLKTKVRWSTEKEFAHGDHPH